MTERLVYPGYTDRQIALIRGEVDPSDNNEWEYVQDHASDLLPDPVRVVSAQSQLGRGKWNKDVDMPVNYKDD